MIHLTNEMPRRTFQALAAYTAAILLGSVTMAKNIHAETTNQVAADSKNSEFAYPSEHQISAGPTDVEQDLETSFPQRDSVFPGFRLPQKLGYEEFKEKAYENYGLKFGFSYQQINQWASATVPSAKYKNAQGGWAGLETSWTPFQRGQDYEGSLVLRSGWRDAIGQNAVPAQYGIRDQGSLWSNYEFTSWGDKFAVEDLYWEQWLGKNRFSFRIGNQIPTAIFNYFRFKDARTSFTASPFAFHDTIPYPTYGLGASFRWWPIKDSELYVVGTLNDMNGDPNARGLDWSTFGRGEYFYGTEIGYFWRRDGGETDHLHLDVFYASKRSTRSPDTLPNVAGGGFKLLGEKQIGRFVGFGSYTYNTAEGGGISSTMTGHTAITGLSYLKPMGLQGEASIGYMWSQAFSHLLPLGADGSQHGIDTYWKILLTPNIWVTPGTQFIWHPVLNPNHNFTVVPDIKFRIFF